MDHETSPLLRTGLLLRHYLKDCFENKHAPFGFYKLQYAAFQDGLLYELNQGRLSVRDTCFMFNPLKYIINLSQLLFRNVRGYKNARNLGLHGSRTITLRIVAFMFLKQQITDLGVMCLY